MDHTGTSLAETALEFAVLTAYKLKYRAEKSARYFDDQISLTLYFPGETPTIWRKVRMKWA